MATSLSSTPQHFSFGGFLLFGRVTSFNGDTPYRSATHEFPKRDGGREEDMGRGQFKLDAKLIFTDDPPKNPPPLRSCAFRYQEFVAFVDANRTAQLVHPIYGSWLAFCKGPSFAINYATATDQIEVPVTFKETDIDQPVHTDAPDVATAAQNCTGQQLQFQQTAATFIGQLGKSTTTDAGALDKIDAALDQVQTTITAPVTFMAGVVNQALGASSGLATRLADIEAETNALVDDVTSFVDASSDLFNGSDDSPQNGDAIASLLNAITNDAEALEAALFAASPTPAGCGDAVADVEVMLASCMTLSDAIAAAQPPTVEYTVPSTMSLLVLAQKLIVDFGLSYDALTYGSILLGLNRIQTPAAIPAGTVLTAPTA